MDLADNKVGLVAKVDLVDKVAAPKGEAVHRPALVLAAGIQRVALLLVAAVLLLVAAVLLMVVEVVVKESACLLTMAGSVTQTENSA